MKFFISIFRFTALVSILGYVIFYNLNFSYWDNFLLVIAIASFAAMGALKVYWFYQLNCVKNLKPGIGHNNEAIS